MNYIFFNNDIFLSNSQTVSRIAPDDGRMDILKTVEEARVCVLDVDVMIAASVETPIEKKDSILVRKFNELYQHEPYIIQDEKIDSNLFQVIGIKEEKVREIYALIPPERVEVLVPYAVALRQVLIERNINLNRTIVFLDDQVKERFLTVFDGLKFSRTRVIPNNGEDILPEIKRSQIDFYKKNEEFLIKREKGFVLIVNNHTLSLEIIKTQEDLQVEFLDVVSPALEGLKSVETNIKFRLPEEILRTRREADLKKKATAFFCSVLIVAIGFLYFLFNKLELGLIDSQCAWGQQTRDQLQQKLSILDREIYREDLKRQKYLNYAIVYLSVLQAVPPDYEVLAFRFLKSGYWAFELSLASDQASSYDPIPRVGLLKGAQIKDVFINNQPGKHLKIML